MGMILSGIVVAIAVAVGAGYFLLNSQQQLPAWQVYTSESARIGDPGHNLVGQNWTGDARPGENADTSG